MTAFQMITYAVYLVFKATYNESALEALDTERGEPSYTATRIVREQVPNTDWYNYNIMLTL